MIVIVIVNSMLVQLLVRDPDKRFGVKQALKVVRRNSSPNSKRGSGLLAISPSSRRRSSPDIDEKDTGGDSALVSCSGGINPAEGLKAHGFFGGVDWCSLLHQSTKAPFVPDLEDTRDCCMFQEFSDRCADVSSACF